MYSAEDRIYGPKGTVQFAVDISPWYIEDPATFNPATVQPQVLFHAVKHNPRPEGTPDNLHLGFSSEIIIRREGTDLIAQIRTGAMQNKIEVSQTISLLPSILDTSGKSPWKVLKLTWGPEPGNFMFYLDGQSSASFSPAAYRGEGARSGMGEYYGGGARGWRPLRCRRRYGYVPG